MVGFLLHVWRCWGRERDELFGEFHYARALYESAERLTVPYPGGQMSHVLRLRPLLTRSLKLFDKDGGVICSKRMRERERDYGKALCIFGIVSAYMSATILPWWGPLVC